eukprot:7093353-Alexandrium_andersonii.AAC.1
MSPRSWSGWSGSRGPALMSMCWPRTPTGSASHAPPPWPRCWPFRRMAGRSFRRRVPSTVLGAS